MRYRLPQHALIRFRAICLVAAVCWAFFAAPVTAGSPDYQIVATVTHLGEIVASPVFVVEEGRTASVEHNMPGGGHYRMAILVRPHSEDEVSVSFSYHSGKLSAQPNVIVPLGEDFEVTSDRLLFGLRIDPVEPEED